MTVRCWERHFQAEGPASMKAFIRIPWDFQDGTRRMVCLGTSLVMGEGREERGSRARLYAADCINGLDITVSEGRSHGVEFESGSDVS